MPKYVIQTTIEKEDYRKFLYYATFLRKKYIIPMLIGIALAGSFMVSYSLERVSVGGVIITTIFMLLAAFGVVIYKVEKQNRQRAKEDMEKVFGVYKKVELYEDRIKIHVQNRTDTFEMPYQEIHQLLVSKDFVILYLTENQATLIRKKDVEEVQKKEIIEFLQSKIKQ